MERPTWATIVGVLGIVFGCLGILGGGQEMFMPKMMEFQKEMLTVIQESTSTASQITVEGNSGEGLTTEGSLKDIPMDELPFDMLNIMEKMCDFPEWFGTWSIFTGISKIIISAFYLFSAICLLQTKPSSIKLFYWAAGLSIALALAKGVFGLNYLSFMGIAMTAGGLFGAMIEVVLIIVVATGNQMAFRAPPPVPQG